MADIVPMTGVKFYEDHGITNIQILANKIIGNLLEDSKFTLIGPTPTFVAATSNTVLGTGTTMAVLETTGAINPVAYDNKIAGVATPGAVAQKWRIKIASFKSAGAPPTSSDAYMSFIRVWVGTELQILNDGTVTSEFENATGAHRDSGLVTIGLDAGSTIRYGNIGEYLPFFSYDGADGTGKFGKTIPDLAAFPLSYNIAVCNHGIAIFCWVEATDNWANKFSWIVIQHLVDPITGAPTTTGKAPVHCLFSIGGGEPENDTLTTESLDPYQNGKLTGKLTGIYRFVVRENDVIKPSVPICATINTVDSAAVINPSQQVSIHENKTFSLTMPNNFNTARYAYKEEMDMVLYTSADVISQWNNVTLTMFTQARTYTAMQSNLPNNAGMRMLLWTAVA